MSIVPLVKATLYGPVAEKDSVLNGLQTLGCMHVNDLHRGVAPADDVPDESGDARAALQYLEDCPVKRLSLQHHEDVGIEETVNKVLNIRDRSRALVEERAQLRRWIKDLEPWGDFHLPSWGQEGALRFWFYVVPLHQRKEVEAIELPWRVISQDHRFAYIVVITADRPAAMPGSPVSLDPRTLSTLRARLGEVERQLEETDYQRIGGTLYIDGLKGRLAEADDRAACKSAALRTHDQDQLFAVQGWVPEASTPALKAFAADHKLAMTITPPTSEEKPPTLFHNPPLLRGGEGLVQFYTTPAYHMWDPSNSVFIAFAIFFGMIFSDAGYGLILGIIMLALWKRLGHSTSGRGMRGLLLALVISCIVYGVLIGSYFGITPRPGSPLAKLRVLNPENLNLMMLIAIGFGVAHLSFANLITAWLRRKSLSALSSVGWACIILGGFMLGVGKSYHVAPMASVGISSLALGGLLVLVFTSKRPFSTSPKALLGRLVDGVKGVAELSKAFGDVLSYLRLFALGLASIKLAEAFNSLAARSLAFKGVGILLAALVLLVGHSINFVMGIMGGVVHGLRLNVIEFFNWSLHGEGEAFRIFAVKERE